MSDSAKGTLNSIRVWNLNLIIFYFVNSFQIIRRATIKIDDSFQYQIYVKIYEN